MKARIVKGFTLIHALVILTCIVLLASLVFLSIQRQRRIAQLRLCEKNLRGVGLAFRTWALDGMDGLVMQWNGTQGGSLEAVTNGQVFRHFQAMSNQLGTSKILACPVDTRIPAIDFDQLTNTNLSYFVGVDARDTYPQMLLSGDRNLTHNALPPSRLITLRSNSVVSWTGDLHKFQGNILFGDGSVSRLNTRSLGKAISNSGSEENRLQFP
jgi:prepilin-type processing-associated H-X9-DG protein